jgi:polyhydroxybutyrate depolymerase
MEASLTAGGLERSYLLYQPPLLAPGAKAPLLLCLHGRGGDAHSMELLTDYGFNLLADREGFFIAYPDGIGRRWRDGRMAVGGRDGGGIDDVAFLSALIDELAAKYSIDRSRVYATGMSNGGMMTFRLALDLQDKIAAFAPVGTCMPEVYAARGGDRRPVPMIVVGGDKDPLVPWEGGDIGILWIKRGRVLSMAQTMKFWAGINGSKGEAEKTMLPDLDPDDGTRVRKEVYCGGSAELVLLAMEGGGHTWPGGWQYLSRLLIGRTCRDMDGCWEIWRFLSRQRLRN